MEPALSFLEGADQPVLVLKRLMQPRAGVDAL